MHKQSESEYSLRTVSPKSARYGNLKRVPLERLEVLEVVETFERSVDLMERINDTLLRSILVLLCVAVLLIFLILAGTALVHSLMQIGTSIYLVGKPPLLPISKDKRDRDDRFKA